MSSPEFSFGPVHAALCGEYGRAPQQQQKIKPAQQQQQQQQQQSQAGGITAHAQADRPPFMGRREGLGGPVGLQRG